VVDHGDTEVMIKGKKTLQEKIFDASKPNFNVMVTQEIDNQ